MMFTRIAYVGTLVLLGLSNSQSFEQFEQKCSALKQYLFNEKNHFDDCTDPINISEINHNEQCFEDKEVFYPINLPLLPIIFAQSEYLPTGQCKEDTRLFLKELQNETLWAVQMFDSSSKYPDGILYGNTRHLGNFDECYNLQVDIARKNNDEISGKYCLVDLQYKRKISSMTSHKSSISDFDLKSSFWEAIEERGNSFRIRRYFLQLALCIPSTCSTKDVETILQSSIEGINKNNNIEVQITVRENFCQVAKDTKVSDFILGRRIYCILILILLTLIIVATWLENNVKLNNDDSSESAFRKAILCFSARRNFKEVFQTRYLQDPGLNSIHLIRFILTIFVMTGHLTLQYYANPIINFVYLEKLFITTILIVYSNGSYIIDMFFAMSAILNTYQLLKDLDQKKRLNFINNVVHRYFRLTPSYMVVIFFHAWILPFLGSGPFWKYKVVQESARCTANWWTNLLYINNYVKSTEICMFQSWYLSANFQFFIFNQFIIYIFWRMSSKIRYFFLGTLTIFSCLILFVATYFYNVTPTLQIMPNVSNIEDIPYYVQHYIKGHVHASANFIGIIAGAILYDYTRKKWQMSKFWLHLSVISLAIILFIAIQLWAHRLLVTRTDASTFEIAFYMFWHRLVPALCICMTIVALSIGSQLEFYQQISIPGWVQPLAVLTYGVYLVQDTLHIYHIGQARSAKMFSIFNLVWDIVPDMVMNFVISLVLVICVEMPFRQLTKQYFSKK